MLAIDKILAGVTFDLEFEWIWFPRGEMIFTPRIQKTGQELQGCNRICKSLQVDKAIWHQYVKHMQCSSQGINSLDSDHV